MLLTYLGRYEQAEPIFRDVIAIATTAKWGADSTSHARHGKRVRDHVPGIEPLRAGAAILEKMLPIERRRSMVHDNGATMNI